MNITINAISTAALLLTSAHTFTLVGSPMTLQYPDIFSNRSWLSKDYMSMVSIQQDGQEEAIMKANN